MRQFKFIFLLLVGLCLCATGFAGSVAPAAPDDHYAIAGIKNAAEFEAAFNLLRIAVATNDRQKVADSILYPLRVNGWVNDASDNSTVQFASRQEMLDNYDKIFTMRVRDAFARQKIADLFVNWQGVMVGRGEAWLSISRNTPVRYGIIAINLGT